MQDNKLNAVGAGSATVTVSYENASDTLAVTVYGVAETDDRLRKTPSNCTAEYTGTRAKTSSSTT